MIRGIRLPKHRYVYFNFIENFVSNNCIIKKKKFMSKLTCIIFDIFYGLGNLM